MAAYSVGYPIYITVQGGAVGVPVVYNLYGKGGKIIYTGVTYPKVANEVIKIDVSPILRSMVDTDYERTSWGDGDYFPASIEFSTQFPGPGVMMDEAVYDYNTDYKPYVDHGITSTLVQDIVDPRQYYTPTVIAQWIVQYSVTDGEGSTVYSGEIDTGTSLNSIIFSADDLSKRTLTIGGTLTFDAMRIGEFTVKIVSPCDHTHCLYYVNKQGGLDWLLVNARTGWSAEDIECRFANDRLNRRDFERRRLRSTVTKKYRLFTDPLTDDESSRMDNVYFAPKAWLMDLDTRTVTSVIITDREFEPVFGMADSTRSHEFTVEESQRYIRQ